MHSLIIATSAIANKKYSRYDEDSATNCENNQCFHFPINFDISKFFILANFFWDILDWCNHIIFYLHGCKQEIIQLKFFYVHCLEKYILQLFFKVKIISVFEPSWGNQKSIGSSEASKPSELRGKNILFKN